MNRYYSDVNNAYYTSRQSSDNIRASGWQSPILTPNLTPSSSLPTLRIIVECPFGSKKCDYTFDKSQRGRLTVIARRRRTFKSDYLLLKNKNHITLQTFTIPLDADLNRLQSYIEHSTNRLIIDIPRLNSSNINTRNTYTNLIHSPDVLPSSHIIHDNTKSSKSYLNHNQKFEYRMDCRGYSADELNVFIQGQDLIVQGETKRALSSNPSQELVSRNFSRKIPLPNTVDLSTVVSYFDNGELCIEAALKREMYSNDRKIPLSGLTHTVVSNRTTDGFNRIQSPKPSNHRRREHVSRHRTYDHEDDRQVISPIRRERSAESLHYPSYRLSRDFDDDDNERENPHRHTDNHKRYSNDRNDSHQPSIHRSLYSPTTNVVTTRTTYRN